MNPQSTIWGLFSQQAVGIQPSAFGGIVRLRKINAFYF
jgi:hypothetical protein